MKGLLPVIMKIWCTTPMRYSVSEADGLIRPKCCTDIVIRHKAVIPENEGKPDKFRIQITDHANKSILGKKDISAVLLPHPEGLSSNEKFESMSSGTTSLLSAMTAAGSATLPPSHRMPSNRSGGSNWLTVLAAVLCLICLFLPESERLSSTAITWLPSYLLPSTTHKLIAAYVLGILTVVLLRN